MDPYEMMRLHQRFESYSEIEKMTRPMLDAQSSMKHLAAVQEIASQFAQTSAIAEATERMRARLEIAAAGAQLNEELKHIAVAQHVADQLAQTSAIAETLQRMQEPLKMAAIRARMEEVVGLNGVIADFVRRESLGIESIAKALEPSMSVVKAFADFAKPYAVAKDLFTNLPDYTRYAEQTLGAMKSLALLTQALPSFDNIRRPDFSGIMDAAITSNALFDNLRSEHPLALLGEFPDTRHHAPFLWSGLGTADLSAGLMGPHVADRRAQRIDVQVDLECGLCGSPMVALEHESCLHSQDSVRIRLGVLPLCSTCMAEAREDPSYFVDALQHLASPRLALIPGDGDGDEVPVANLRIVQTDPEHNDG